MHPIVEVRSSSGDQLLVVVDRRLEVGRECDGVLLGDPLASRRHLALSPAGATVRVEDLGSSNGTQLNGRSIVGTSEVGPGDVVTVGETELRLASLVASDAPVSPPVDDVRGTMIRGGPPAAPDAGPTGDPAGSVRSTVAARSTPPPPPPPAPPGSAERDLPPPPPPPPVPPLAAPAVVDASPAVVRPAPASAGADDLRSTSIDRVAAEVVDDAPALAVSGLASAGPESPQHRGSTVTIGFSDIEQSTEQAEAMGDHRWYRALLAHNAIIEELVARYDGTVVKSVGDGFMVTFTSAGQATRWAIAVQQSITEYGQSHPEEAVRVRLGLHTGEAIEAGGDLFGIHVHTAARIANLANGGQIVVSSLTRAIAAPSGEFDFGPEQPVSLKGLSGNHAVSELLWEPVEA